MRLNCPGINKNRIDGKTVGVMPYHSLSMFKAILLQSWHSLSDKELEDALKKMLLMLE